MLGESLLTLAALAGQMVVDAATSDGWEKAERGYAQLLGRGNAEQAKLARRWLEETREQLSRDCWPLPRMKLNQAVKNIRDFRFEDFELLYYDPHPSIKAPIAV